VSFALLTVALGFDEETEWSTATSRKRRRATKRGEDEDEDYVVDRQQAKPVTEDGVAKVMSTLLQAREQWVITKLLTRLEVKPL
jgi:[histone H3]-lysine36 N-trimethyltransferase